MAVRKVDFLVLGGGASGLSAVFYLQRLLGERLKRVDLVDEKPQFRNKIALLEASPHIGGWIHSTRTPEGSIHEAGPRSMRPAGIVGRNSLNLASSLGLDDEVIPVLRSHPAAQRRFTFTGGKLHQFPSSFATLLTRQEPFSRPLAVDLAREVLVKRSKGEDESMFDFGVRRFGKEITENLIDPFCRGVFAGKTTELSVRSCFPQLFSFERQRGSVILGGLLGPTAIDPTVGESDLVRRAKKERWSIWSLKGGLQCLAEKLSEVVQRNGAEVRTQMPCTKIEFVLKENGGNKKIARVHTAESVWEADRLICGIPAANLAEVLPVDLSPLSLHLQQIQSVTAAVVNLEFEGSHLPTEGFGYLVPSREPSNVLGVIFDSCAFPQHDRPEIKSTRMTCMMGGAWFHDLFGDPDKVDCDWLASVALATLKTQIGLSAKPTYCRVNLSKDCIPNYKVNHHRLLETIDAYVADNDLPLTLVGSSYKGVSVNDCIYNSRLAAQRLVPDGQLAV
ncbi:protoporphyrinogen oxidase-like [Patiria miniata]|uniref:Protoporphyrinogen oxidase n=1 Tax=Patiria miniata TaxID=46514 RepID=A0A914AHC2_PATMI|nr:protoporphyrinogen oxidase-like [Patiria miniata]